VATMSMGDAPQMAAGMVFHGAFSGAARVQAS
jgi:hypothetical protein